MTQNIEQELIDRSEKLVSDTKNLQNLLANDPNLAGKQAQQLRGIAVQLDADVVDHREEFHDDSAYHLRLWRITQTMGELLNMEATANENTGGPKEQTAWLRNQSQKAFAYAQTFMDRSEY